jgi:hypothetical protein
MKPNKYTEKYEEWKEKSGDDASSNDKSRAEKLRGEMIKMEKGYSYEYLAAIRQITISKHNLEYRK